MKTYYLLLDLKNDLQLISAYEDYHKNVWPGILEQIKTSGIVNCEIYRVHNRLLMVLETDDTFSFEKKAMEDTANPLVQEWEELMWKYQQAIPGSAPGEKWQLMERIFSL